MSLSPRHGCIGLILILLAIFAVYAPSLSNGYAMDDRIVAMGINDQGEVNKMVWNLRPIGDYLDAHYWKGSVKEDTLYRPVTVYSYALVHQLAKPSEPDFSDKGQLATAFPQHLVNVLFHLLAVVLVYLLVRRLRFGVGPALLAAVVFGLHAIHSETVAGIVGRAEIFGFVFGAMGTVLLFAAEPRGTAIRMLTAPVAAFLFFLAFSSKEVAVAWVGFLAVYGLAYRWQTRDEEAWLKGAALTYARHLIVAAVPLAVFLYLRHQVVGGFQNLDPVAWIVNPLFHASTGERLMSAIFVWGWKGLGLTLAPFHLAGNYGATVLPVITSFLDLRFLGMLAVLLVTLVAALVAARKHPLPFVGVCTFFGFSFIISNLPFAIGTMFAERLYYTPSLGLALFAAWLIDRTGGRPNLRMAVGVAAAVWLGASSLVILQRNAVWENDDVFFMHEARNQPRSVRMLLCAAGIHTDQLPPEREAAVRYLKSALELDPEYALAWNNLAAIYLDSGRLEMAEECVITGLQSKHINEGDDTFKLQLNLGLIRKSMGRRDEAFAAMKEALFLQPKFERSWEEILLLSREDTEKKVPGAYDRMFAAVAEAAKKFPEQPYWPFFRGLLLFELEKPDEAVAEYRKALALDPKHVASRLQLLAMVQGKVPGEETMRLANEGDAVDLFVANFAYHRAVTHAQAKRWPETARELVAALARDPDYAPAWTDLQNLATVPEGTAPALAAVEAMAAARPDSPVWPFFHGVLLARGGKLPEGMNRMGDALQLRPSFTRAWSELITMSGSEGGGGPARALEIITRAGDGANRGAREWPFYSGALFNATGQVNAAATQFMEALRRDPAFLEPRIELLSITWDAYPPAMIRRVIRGGLAAYPDSPQWPLFRGLLLYREGKPNEALPQLAKALTGLPGHPLARLTVGECLVAIGQTADARKVFQSLVDQKDCPPVYLEKAKAALDKLGAK